MLKYSLTACLLVCFGLFLPACTSDIGESCATRGSQEECVEGAVCDNDASGNPVCLKVCTDAAQCAADEDCNGVSGSNIKACTAKPK